MEEGAAFQDEPPAPRYQAAVDKGAYGHNNASHPQTSAFVPGQVVVIARLQVLTQTLITAND